MADPKMADQSGDTFTVKVDGLTKWKHFLNKRKKDSIFILWRLLQQIDGLWLHQVLNQPFTG